MKTVFILFILWNGQDPDMEGQALWAMETLEQCETVAEIFSLNSDPEEGFVCREEKGQ